MTAFSTSPRQRFRRWTLPVLTLALAGLACSKNSAKGRPHVILIVVDTLRADALLDPAGRVDTPNIDALAGDAIIFPQAFSHAPMTLPSHTALFTSRLPFDTGVLNNAQIAPAHYPMLAEWLGEYGYDTHAVISLGTLNLPGQDGVRRGFDEFDGRLTRYFEKADDVKARLDESLDNWGSDAPLFLFAHFSDPHEPYYDHNHDPREGELLVDGEVVGSMSISDPRLFKKDIELEAGTHKIEMRAESRFRLREFGLSGGGEGPTVPTWEEGDPDKGTKYARGTIETPLNRDGTYKLRVWMAQALTQEQIQQRYIREVEYVDEYIGRFIGELKRRGLYEDSIIVFTSDHGEALGENGGFVGHVHNLSDTLIHVPLIIRLPEGHPRAGELRAKDEALVSHISLVPTLLDLLSIPELPDQKGTSILDELPGVHLAETHTPEAEHNLVCLRDSEYKLIYLADEDRFELFDLKADPAELVDVFAERGSERAAWQEKLRSIATLAADRRRRDDELSPEVQRQLKALGY